LEHITYEQLVGVVAFVLAACGAYSAIMSAVKTHRDEQKIKNAPIEVINGRLDTHDKCLASDKVRIEALEKAQNEFNAYNAKQDTCMNVLVRSQLAMLRHMQHGNNVDGMKASENEITDLLTHRMDSK